MTPTVSAVRSVTRQQVLWPSVNNRPLDSAAAVRHYVGRFFEEATRLLTGAAPHLLDRRVDICPDLSHGPGSYLEVKALGGSSAYLFAHRLEADRDLAAAHVGGSVTYVYWLHDAPATQARDLDALHAMLAIGARRVLVIPGERLRAAARRMPVISLHYRAAGPAVPAYRFNRSQLEAMARGPEVQRTVHDVYGCRVGPVSIAGCLGRFFAPLSTDERISAAEMRAELSERYLDVALVPAPRPAFEGHMVRVAMNGNPSWYRRLARALPSKRRRATRHRRRNSDDTDIRRPLVEAALDRLARGVCRHPYDFHLRPFLGRIA